LPWVVGAHENPHVMGVGWDGVGVGKILCLAHSVGRVGKILGHRSGGVGVWWVWGGCGINFVELCGVALRQPCKRSPSEGLNFPLHYLVYRCLTYRRLNYRCLNY
jgi:hypothetical protein